MKRWVKALRLTGKIALWLVSVLAAAWCLLYCIFSFQLNGALARLRKELYPVNIRQLVRTVPVKANAAPSYCAAFALMTRPADRFEVNVRQGTLTAEVTRLNDLWAKRIMRNQPLTVKEKKQVLAALSSPSLRKALALIEDDARKSDCDFNLKWTAGLSMLLPHLALMRSAARLTAFQAIMTAEAGDPDRACRWIVSGLRMSNHLREPLIISELVRIACDTILLTALEQVTNRSAISSDRARMIRRELAEHRDPQALSRAAAGERVLGMDAIRRIMATGGSTGELTGGPAPATPRWLRKSLAVVWLPVYKKDLATYIVLFTDWEQIARSPYYSVPPGYRLENRLRRVPRVLYLTRTFLPAMERVRTMGTQHQAAVEVASTALALKIYRNECRVYPASLEDLMPDITEAAPLDPFTGRPLVYRRRGAGFIVYSLGPNLADDNGRRKTPDYYGNDYDIVCMNDR